MKLISCNNFIYKGDNNESIQYLYSPIFVPSLLYPKYEVSSSFIDKIFLPSMDIPSYIINRVYHIPIKIIKKKVGKKSTLDKLLASDEEDYISILKKEGLI